MTDHINNPERSTLTDYERDELLPLRSPEQFKAIGDATRQRIIGLVREQAATTSQIAEVLGQPKGTINHHLKVLLAAGLIKVVWTRQVRAITEKYYGATARMFELDSSEVQPKTGNAIILQQALNEIDPDEGNPSKQDGTMGIHHARIPLEEAVEFVARLQALMQEFEQRNKPGQGHREYGFVAGIYRTNRPSLLEPGLAEGEQVE